MTAAARARYPSADMRLALALLLGLAAPGAAAPARLLCYRARTRGVPPVVRGLQLTDRYVAGRFDLRAPLDLCVAADGLGAGVMIGYRAVPAGRARAPAAATAAEVTSELGSITGAAGRVVGAFVSTATAGPYLCHTLRGYAGPHPHRAIVADPLHPAARALDVGAPARLCVAAARNGDEVTNPGVPLLCYRVRARRRTRLMRVPTATGVVDVTGEAALCVAASIGN